MHEPERHPNRGKPPRDKTAIVGVQFRNGRTSKHSYPAGGLRWSITDDEWTIALFWRAD